MTYQLIIDAPKYQGLAAKRFFFDLASGARACADRVLAGLHESRRNQAARQLTKFRRLMHDPATGA